jgi:hypothetical protein
VGQGILLRAQGRASSRVRAGACGPDGWHVDGRRQVIAYGRELPSRDGDYWSFYRGPGDGIQTPVYYFFTLPRSF